ncbi:unnamed protein product, partial [Heterosigma akashiwo]
PKALQADDASSVPAPDDSLKSEISSKASLSSSVWEPQQEAYNFSSHLSNSGLSSSHQPAYGNAMSSFLQEGGGGLGFGNALDDLNSAAAELFHEEMRPSSPKRLLCLHLERSFWSPDDDGDSVDGLPASSPSVGGHGGGDGFVAPAQEVGLAKGCEEHQSGSLGHFASFLDLVGPSSSHQHPQGAVASQWQGFFSPEAEGTITTSNDNSNTRLQSELNLSGAPFLLRNSTNISA